MTGAAGMSERRQVFDDGAVTASEVEAVELRVVAGPGGAGARAPVPAQAAREVAAGVEQADGRHVARGEAALPPRFAQERVGLEHGGRLGMLVGEDRGKRHGGLGAAAGVRRVPGSAEAAPAGKLGGGAEG